MPASVWGAYFQVIEVNTVRVTYLVLVTLTFLILFFQVMEVNAIGAVRVTLAFLPLLKRARGRVVNASCVFGRLACPLAMPYCMSKAALESFTDALR